MQIYAVCPNNKCAVWKRKGFLLIPLLLLSADQTPCRYISDKRLAVYLAVSQLSFQTLPKMTRTNNRCFFDLFAQACIDKCKLNVTQLRSKLLHEGLCVDGLKSDLVSRLTAATFAKSLTKEEKESAVLAFMSAQSVSFDDILRNASDGDYAIQSEEANKILLCSSSSKGVVQNEFKDIMEVEAETGVRGKVETTPAMVKPASSEREDELTLVKTSKKAVVKDPKDSLPVDCSFTSSDAMSTLDASNVIVEVEEREKFRAKTALDSSEASSKDSKKPQLQPTLGAADQHQISNNEMADEPVSVGGSAVPSSNTPKKRKRQSTPVGCPVTCSTGTVKATSRRCSAPPPGARDIVDAPTGTSVRAMIAQSRAADTSTLTSWCPSVSNTDGKIRLIIVGSMNGCVAAFSGSDKNGESQCKAIVYCSRTSLTGQTQIERSSFAVNGAYDSRDSYPIFEHECSQGIRNMLERGGNEELLLMTAGDRAAGKTTMAFGKNAGHGPFETESDLGLFSHMLPRDLLLLVNQNVDWRAFIVTMSIVRVELRKNGCHEHVVDLLADKANGGIMSVSGIDDAVSIPFQTDFHICHLLEKASPDNVGEDEPGVTSSIVTQIKVFTRASARVPHCRVTTIESYCHLSKCVSDLIQSNAKNKSDRAVLIGCVDTTPENARKCATSLRSMQSIVDGYQEEASGAKRRYSSTSSDATPIISNRSNRRSARSRRSTDRSSDFVSTRSTRRPHTARSTVQRRGTTVSITGRPSTAVGRPPLRASARRKTSVR
mmetsp:Transcript_28762/g.63903  ORF Transcript_28762/g.63903 Transcript_28762/m.63903 type:complete len:773 (+) Transcript_28762:265-2583(+)